MKNLTDSKRIGLARASCEGQGEREKKRENIVIIKYTDNGINI